MPLAERDSSWSRHFTDDSSRAVKKADEIIQWALNAGMANASTEPARLAATTFVCLFSITNRRIRDRGTKALVTILLGTPNLFFDLMQRFGMIDDPYVLERLLAAGYGAICIDPSSDRIHVAAQAVAATIFSENGPPVHLAVRDLACAIMERASTCGRLPPGFDVTRVRSRFASAPPQMDLDQSVVDAAAVAAGDGRIASSCGENEDFGIYEISYHISDFSDMPLSEPAPLTIDERAEHKPPQCLDVRSARRWVALRAYELGWTKERFPNEPSSADRNRPNVERIGKKYQWIALGELTARLADNFWLNAEHEQPTRRYQSKLDLRYMERFDPTVLGPVRTPVVEVEITQGPPPLVLEDVDEAALDAWPFLADHFDTPMPRVIANMDGKEWLIANWVESLNERLNRDKHDVVSDPFRRQIQAFVSLVAYRAGNRHRIVREFLRGHDRGMMGWSLSARVDGYFAYEVVN